MRKYASWHKRGLTGYFPPQPEPMQTGILSIWRPSLFASSQWRIECSVKKWVALGESTPSAIYTVHLPVTEVPWQPLHCLSFLLVLEAFHPKQRGSRKQMGSNEETPTAIHNSPSVLWGPKLWMHCLHCSCGAAAIMPSFLYNYKDGSFEKCAIPHPE